MDRGNYKKVADVVKAERLIYITQSVKHRGPISARQLAVECSVTKRTIYRDFKSPEGLNDPIFYDPGKSYRTAFNKKIKLGDINMNDADLVLFCLYHNPLSNSPFFRRRLMFLKELLQKEFEKKLESKKDSVFFFDSAYTGLADEHYEKVSKFLFAIYHNCEVFLLEKGSFSKSEALRPIGVRFIGSGATLILFSERDNSDYRVDVEDLQGIGISTSSFDSRPREVMEIQRSEANY